MKRYLPLQRFYNKLGAGKELLHIAENRQGQSGFQAHQISI